MRPLDGTGRSPTDGRYRTVATSGGIGGQRVCSGRCLLAYRRPGPLVETNRMSDHWPSAIAGEDAPRLPVFSISRLARSTRTASEPALKAPVEIGDIAEADFESNVAYAHLAMAWVDQHGFRTL